jgi:hypothetical protein
MKVGTRARVVLPKVQPCKGLPCRVQKMQWRNSGDPSQYAETRFSKGPSHLFASSFSGREPECQDLGRQLLDDRAKLIP